MNLHDYESDVTRYAVEITHTLVSRGSSRENAEDAVQDMLLKMLTLDVFIAPDKLRAFMYRVAIRDYINKYHRAQRYQTIIERLGHDLQDFAPPNAEESIEELLTRLPGYEAQLLSAYYYGRQSTKELSARFGYSVSKIKIDLYRARKKFRKILEKEGYEEWTI